MNPDEFRQWYEGRGWSQAQTAEALGIPSGQHRISEWATGKREIPPYIVAHLRTLDRLRDCEHDG